MKKIILLLILIVGIGSLMGATYTQTKNYTGTSTTLAPHSLTFNEYNVECDLLSVEIIFHLKAENGNVIADNDDPNSTATYDFQLGGTATMTNSNVGGTKPLSNSSFQNPWFGDAENGTSGSLAVEPADGQPGHDTTPADFLDGTPDDGASYTGQTEMVTVSDFIDSGSIGSFVGSGTFNYGVVVTALNNINAAGGQVDGGFTAADLSGYVTVIYTDDCDITPVTLSSFTAMYLTDGAQLQWTTQSESANMGWNIYRSTTGSAEEAAQLNVGLIEGAGTVSEPTDYMFTDSDDLTTGQTYYYWIEDVTYGNVTELHGPVSVQVTEEGVTPDSPEIFEQAQIHNYPNPFNPATSLYFSLKDNEVAESIEIYNVRGQKVRSFDAPVNPQQWDGRDMSGTGVSSGIYMYVLKTSQNNYVKKMVLSK